jgi:hypothetical protein
MWERKLAWLCLGCCSRKGLDFVRRGLFCFRVCLFCGEGDALFEDVECNVGFVLVDDERGTEADGSFAAAEDEEAALEGEIDDLVAHGAYRRAGLFIFDEFDADHETATANVANGGMFGNPGTKAREHLFANGCGVLEAFALEDVQRGKGSGDADWVAAEGAGV